MRSSITARHTEIPAELRRRVEDLIPRLARFAHRPQGVDVILDEEHGQKLAEIIITLPQGAVAVARAEAADFPTALDRVADKLKHQLDGKGRPGRGNRR
jgi:ribosomal subunit interface protein